MCDACRLAEHVALVDERRAAEWLGPSSDLDEAARDSWLIPAREAVVIRGLGAMR